MCIHSHHISKSSPNAMLHPFSHSTIHSLCCYTYTNPFIHSFLTFLSNPDITFTFIYCSSFPRPIFVSVVLYCNFTCVSDPYGLIRRIMECLVPFFILVHTAFHCSLHNTMLLCLDKNGMQYFDCYFLQLLPNKIFCSYRAQLPSQIS